MLNFDRKLIVVLVLLSLLTVGAYIYKSTYNNKIPKSAKLVLLNQNKCSAIG